MYDFTQNKINKTSLAKRKLVHGHGVNDADYVAKPQADGKQIICPIYSKWQSMLMRCYSAKFQEKKPTYIGCTVSDEWLLFSNFRKWMLSQEWQGMELDKDIKFQGNKIYSPETCLFIPAALNALLVDCAAARGNYPVGVCWHKGNRRFMAQLSFDGKRKHLGYFATPEEASDVYQLARKEKIMQLIRDDVYPMATAYLEQHV